VGSLSTASPLTNRRQVNHARACIFSSYLRKGTYKKLGRYYLKKRFVNFLNSSRISDRGGTDARAAALACVFLL
jgi:hypothetical protein